MRRVTRSAVVVLPLLLTMAVAGCGSGGNESEVASAGGGTSTPGASATSTASQHDRALKFAQCMREHGVDMEDPKPGEGVRFSARPGHEDTLQKAQEACRKYAPGADRKPGEKKEDKERATKFAACMREHGVEDFPDPDPDQPGLVKIDKSLAGDPDFEDAQKACQDVLSGGRKTPGDS